MKHYTTLIATLLAIALTTACTKDKIEYTDTQAIDADSGNDNLDSVSIDRTVTIVYTDGSATVSGLSAEMTASTNGGHVTIENSSTDVVDYQLSGSSTNGSLKIYSGKKQVITLNSLSLTNPNGAAINIQGPKLSPGSGKRAFIVLQGSNSLADGANYSTTPDGEDEKAALFSEGKLIVCGNGELTVTATGKAGITSDDYIHFQSATVHVSSSAGHGVRGKDYILVSGGTIDIAVSANGKKGMSSDSLVCFAGGETTVAVTGSTVVQDGDTARSAGIKADVRFVMAGGSLQVTNSGTGGKGISGDGDALFGNGNVAVTTTGTNFGTTGGYGRPGQQRSNNSVAAKGIKFDGNISITGGTVTASSASHEAIEAKGTLAISGGTVYAYSAGDDAINASGDLTISGGYVCGHSAATGMGADGIDANGNMYIDGGLVYAICAHGNPDVALDANSEGGKKLYIRGGTLIAVGGLESGAQLSQTCYSASSVSLNTWHSIAVGSTVHAFKTPSSGSGLVVSGSVQPVVMRSPDISGGTEIFNGMMKLNATCSGGTEVSLSTYTGGGGGGHWH